MSLVDDLRHELERETAITRRLLERLADDRMSWKPHDKSMSLQQLGSHVADVMSWTETILEEDEFAMGEGYSPWSGASRAEMVEHFDATTAHATGILKDRDDSHMRAVWKMRAGDKVLYEGSRIDTLRSFILNHMVHHRGQLSVYLRLTETPVPSIYGPSADES